MSSIDKLISEIQEKNRSERQQQHTQTVSLAEGTHIKLTKLSEHLQISKTSLASKLLTAAIDDAFTKVVGDKNNSPEGKIVQMLYDKAIGPAQALAATKAKN
jgi:hypothetical protein